MMDISTFAMFVYLISVPFFGYVQSKDPPLTPFGKKAREEIPDETFKKIFEVNIENKDELAKAVMEGYKNMFDILGIPFDESVIKETDDDNDSLGQSTISPELLFHAQTYAISKALKSQGVLKKGNEDDVVRRYIDELNKAAESLKDEDIVSTFVAQSTAIANFLKDEGVTSEKSVKEFNEDYIQELNKYKEDNTSILGSLINGVLGLLGL